VACFRVNFTFNLPLYLLLYIQDITTVSTADNDHSFTIIEVW
jgi:hypothetical protein